MSHTGSRRPPWIRPMTEDELYLVAEDWSAIFNHVEPDAIEQLITDAAVHEWFDDRTNLYLMTGVEPTDLALVLSCSPGPADRYLVVRFDGEAWIVDGDPVDWDELEDAGFAADAADPEEDNEDHDPAGPAGPAGPDNDNDDDDDDAF